VSETPTEQAKLWLARGFRRTFQPMLANQNNTLDAQANQIIYSVIVHQVECTERQQAFHSAYRE
jgi:hypothetical protein